MSFHITQDAAQFIQKYVIGVDAPEEIVMIIVPAASIALNQNKSDDDIRSREVLAQIANEVAKRPPQMRWEVGGISIGRVPIEDCRIVDGIKTYIPAEMEKLLRDRVLRLDRGVLRLDPDPGSVEIDSSVIR